MKGLHVRLDVGLLTRSRKTVYGTGFEEWFLMPAVVLCDSANNV